MVQQLSFRQPIPQVKDIRYAPAWIADIIRKLTFPKGVV